MPFIFHTNNTLSSFDKFNLIVEKYKHVVDNNPTARCMVGFTAASFIRNEGDIDIESLETWLQSIESDTNFDLSTDTNDQQDQQDTHLDKILYVVKNSTTIDDNYESYDEEEETEDDSEINSDLEEELKADHMKVEHDQEYDLDRFISRDPYTPIVESYTSHIIYQP